MVQDRFLTVPEIAEQLHVSEWTVREWLRTNRLRGYLPAGRRGGWRVKEADLERYIEGTANRPDGEDSYR
jgi:excisionase family DNA binding protein